MIYIKLTIAAFILLESMNVIFLYFFPQRKLANSMGVFKAWEESKQDPRVFAMISYLVNWVAGTKLIILLLLLVLLLTAGAQTLVLAAAALALGISVFFWRLFPAMREMDQQGQIDPPGYSSTLGWMIGAMVLLFSAAALAALI